MSDLARLDQFARSAESGWRAHAAKNRRMLVPLVGGIGLAGWGVTRRGTLGTLAALGGAYLTLESVNRIRPYRLGIHISQTINKPVAEVYRFACELDNWALILEKIGQSAESSRRAARAPINRRIDANTQIWKEEKDHVIAWQSRGRNARRRGSMHFRPAAGGRGTEVLMGLQYDSPETLIERGIGMLIGKDPERRAREALRAMKQLLEAGESPTIQGQPRGRRGMRGKVMQFVFDELRPRTRAAA